MPILCNVIKVTNPGITGLQLLGDTNLLTTSAQTSMNENTQRIPVCLNLANRTAHSIQCEEYLSTNDIKNQRPEVISAKNIV